LRYLLFHKSVVDLENIVNTVDFSREKKQSLYIDYGAVYLRAPFLLHYAKEINMFISRIRKLTDGFKHTNPLISGSNIIFSDYGSETLYVYKNGASPELYPLTPTADSESYWFSGNSIVWRENYDTYHLYASNGIVSLPIPTSSRYRETFFLGIWGKIYAWAENLYEDTEYTYNQKFVKSKIYISSIDSFIDEASNSLGFSDVSSDIRIEAPSNYLGISGSAITGIKTITWLGERELTEPNLYYQGKEIWGWSIEREIYTLNTSAGVISQLTTNGSGFSQTGSFSRFRELVVSGANSAWIDTPNESGMNDMFENVYFYNAESNTRTLISNSQYYTYGLKIAGDYIGWKHYNPDTSTENLFIYKISTGEKLQLNMTIGDFDISGDNIVWKSYGESYGIYVGKITDDYTFDIETPDIVSGGEMYNGQPLGVDPIVRNIKFNLIGDQEFKDQWEPRKTWVIIHGWNDDSSGFQELADTLKQAAPDDIVLTLDWREAAGSLLTGSATTWIRPVAEVAAQLLKDWGLTQGKYLNLIGHSLGSLLSSEIAAQFVYENGSDAELNQQNLGADTITALDPPEDVSRFVWSSYDLDGRIPGIQSPQHFDQVSRFSRSFVGDQSIAGNKEYSSWADESIIMDFGNMIPSVAEHRYVVNAFEQLTNTQSERNLFDSLFNSNDYLEPHNFKKDGFQEKHEGILKVNSETFLPIEFRAKKPNSNNPFGEAEIVYGTSKDDTLFGTSNRIISGGAGDSIFGGGGDDIIYGSSFSSPFGVGVDNNDTLNGGAGNDTLLGQGGDDILEGGEGNDILQDSSGKDFLDGGNGNDVLDTSISSKRDYDYLNGREENDPLLGGGGGGNPLLGGGGGGGNPLLSNAEDSQLTGKKKSNLDSNNSLFGGDDYLNGGAGNDTLRSGIGNDALNGGTGEDLLFGGSGDDQLNGDEGDDALYGESGNDGLIGNLGNDSLFGGDGDDNLYGNAGNDFLNGGLGKDYISGGEGNDVIRGDGDDVISITDSDSVSKNAPSLKANTPITEEINNVNGDILDGGIGNDYLTGSSGNDSLIGGIGIDSLFGEDGNDTLYANYAEGVVEDSLDLKEKNREVLDGGAGDDYLLGSLRKDFLIGGAGNDYLLGGLGQDSLIGGAGDDTLIGGRGADSFVFENQVAKFDLGHDTVKQFRGGQGDKIVLSKSTFSKLGSKPGSGFKIKSEFATISTKNTRKSFSTAEFSSALIVYNSSTGQLFYNPNGIGNGFGKGGLFATIQDNLRADNFRIINSLL